MAGRQDSIPLEKVRVFPIPQSRSEIIAHNENDRKPQEIVSLSIVPFPVTTRCASVVHIVEYSRQRVRRLNVRAQRPPQIVSSNLLNIIDLRIFRPPAAHSTIRDTVPATSEELRAHAHH